MSASLFRRHSAAGRGMDFPDIGVPAMAVAVASGPWLRGLVFAHSVAYRHPLRRRCPTCGVVAVRVAGRGVLAAAPVDGRCHLCGVPLGRPVGTVEGTAAAVLVVLALVAPSGWVLAAWSWTALLGIALAYVDLAVLRLPDALTVAAGLGSLALLGVAAVATDSPGRWWQALAGGLGLGVLYSIPILSRAMGMGRGDRMLAVVVGINVGWLGLAALVTATVATAAIAAVYTVAKLVGRQLRLTDHVPVGPFILIGGLVAIVRHAV
ncbi:type 4 prepilin-like proteins leader peptide-processing enzyme [Virgisporangium aurantiacum]|uniref:Type 4 prepilin-like proteins leader peptide-processing enzyme n=2 Tax=Virgisporangium aurantiacum TaxID=175570 RepID=A0A8J4E5J9_9ACTN|nr:type 4 prepilin-like proteins leader peptide-processing enzyme [Virgisporangium aurantiacum]